MSDYVKDGILYHPVLKIWNGIVSVGSYTVEKCKKKNLKLGIYYKYPDGNHDVMVLTLDEIKDKGFQLHQKTIKGQFGQPYVMHDFKWNPCKHTEFYSTATVDYVKCKVCGKYEKKETKEADTTQEI